MKENRLNQEFKRDNHLSDFRNGGRSLFVN
jgi:hypothetical protein